MQVVDPSGSVIWSEPDAVEGSFAFTSTMFGEHKICMISMAKRGACLWKRRVDPFDRERV